MRLNVDQCNEEFQSKLSLVASAIRRDAEGRVCGDCAHFRQGWCDEHVNLEGGALEVASPSAVACRSHVVRVDAPRAAAHR